VNVFGTQCRYVYIKSVAKVSLLNAPKIIKISGRITKLQSVKQRRVFIVAQCIPDRSTYRQ